MKENSFRSFCFQPHSAVRFAVAVAIFMGVAASSLRAVTYAFTTTTYAEDGSYSGSVTVQYQEGAKPKLKLTTTDDNQTDGGPWATINVSNGKLVASGNGFGVAGGSHISLRIEKSDGSTFTANTLALTYSTYDPGFGRPTETGPLTIRAYSGTSVVGTIAFTNVANGQQFNLNLATPDSGTFANITGLDLDFGYQGAAVTGLAIDETANTAPTISDITNKTTAQNTSTGAIAFTVGDTETAAASLNVTRSSSNTTLVPNANIVLGGSGANRTVTITPAAGQSGTATITLTVTDGGSATASDTFVLTVTPDTTPPTVVSVVRHSPAGQTVGAGPVTFRVTYSEAVQGVAASSYEVDRVSGNIDATVGTPTGGPTIYDVPVTINSGAGEFRLKVIY